MASAAIPASSAMRAIASALRWPAAQPVRILSVTGTSTAATTASRMRATSASSRISAEPAQALQTFLAGQPMLMSMICAPWPALWRAASAICTGSVPAIWTLTGAGSPAWSMRRSDLVVFQKRGSLVVISDTARPAPSCLHSSRKGLSVTPAMGARTTRGSMAWGPIRMAPLSPAAGGGAWAGSVAAAAGLDLGRGGHRRGGARPLGGQRREPAGPAHAGREGPVGVQRQRGREGAVEGVAGAGGVDRARLGRRAAVVRLVVAAQRVLAVRDEAARRAEREHQGAARAQRAREAMQALVVHGHERGGVDRLAAVAVQQRGELGLVGGQHVRHRQQRALAG